MIHPWTTLLSVFVRTLLTAIITGCLLRIVDAAIDGVAALRRIANALEWDDDDGEGEEDEIPPPMPVVVVKKPSRRPLDWPSSADRPSKMDLPS